MSENQSMDGVVEIHGKLYVTVARRIQDFREKYPEWTVETEIMSAGANVVLVQARILNDEGRMIGVGHAEEERESSNINRTSAIENCETSAIGRALAACGYGSEFYASANEMQSAEYKQELQKMLNKGIAYGRAFEVHKEAIDLIKTSIATGDLTPGAEAWYELTHDEMASIWLAPTKGGVFTTIEREVIKSSEWRKAHYGDDNEGHKQSDSDRERGSGPGDEGQGPEDEAGS